MTASIILGSSASIHRAINALPPIAVPVQPAILLPAIASPIALPAHATMAPHAQMETKPTAPVPKPAHATMAPHAPVETKPTALVPKPAHATMAPHAPVETKQIAPAHKPAHAMTVLNVRGVTLPSVRPVTKQINPKAQIHANVTRTRTSGNVSSTVISPKNLSIKSVHAKNQQDNGKTAKQNVCAMMVANVLKVTRINVVFAAMVPNVLTGIYRSVRDATITINPQMPNHVNVLIIHGHVHSIVMMAINPQTQFPANVMNTLDNGIHVHSTVTTTTNRQMQRVLAMKTSVCGTMTAPIPAMTA